MGARAIDGGGEHDNGRDNALDDLALQIGRELARVEREPGSEGSLQSRQARRIAEFVLDRYVEIDYAADAVLLGRDDEIERMIVLLAYHRSRVGRPAWAAIARRRFDVLSARMLND